MEGYSLIAITRHLCIKPLGSSQYAWLDVSSIHVTHPSVCYSRECWVCVFGGPHYCLLSALYWLQMTNYVWKLFIAPVCKDRIFAATRSTNSFCLYWLILAS
jgi:hypothetical protein